MSFSTVIRNRIHALLPETARDAAIFAKAYRARAVLQRLFNRIQRSDKPVVIGPWTSEVGFEILYWIPFVNWLRNILQLAPERLIVVSRGGASSWYRHITGQYIDFFDYFTIKDFEHALKNRLRDYKVQKQNRITQDDRRLITMLTRTLKVEEYEWLHPSLMYQLFQHVWIHAGTLEHIRRYTRFDHFSSKVSPCWMPDLPERFVAVKFYQSAAFPDTEENRRFIRQLVERLSRRYAVVYLRTGLTMDDHLEFALPDLPDETAVTVTDPMYPAENLAIQTEIVRRAEFTVGTYGGFSYLAPFVNRPAIAFYSDADKYMPIHEDVARRALRVLRYGVFNISKKQRAAPRHVMSEHVVLSTHQYNVIDRIGI